MKSPKRSALPYDVVHAGNPAFYFVCQAVDFYIGYLRQQKNIDYLTPALAGAIKSEVESVERHLSEMLFRLAVEQGVGDNLLAAISDVTPEMLQPLHDSCAREVARTNGIINTKYAYEWQKG